MNITTMTDTVKDYLSNNAFLKDISLEQLKTLNEKGIMLGHYINFLRSWTHKIPKPMRKTQEYCSLDIALIH